MKKSITFLGILALVLLITGCGKQDLDGIWQMTSSNCNDELSTQNLSINMSDNENGTMYKDEGELVCTITVKDDKFICTSPDGETNEYKYDDSDENHLVLSRNNTCGYRYTKK